MLRKLLLAFGGLVLLAQLVPVDRSNPPVEAEVEAPPEVLAVLRRSCYDCHSHEVRWPWYSYLAPVSWLVASDVAEAREHLDFSTWNRYSAEEREDLREDTFDQVAEGEMPLPLYLRLHPEARVSGAELALLRAWAGKAEAEEEGREHGEHGRGRGRGRSDRDRDDGGEYD